MPRDCTCSLHVSRIGKGVKVSDLREAFESYGKIKDVYIPLDYYTKESRGFGYVEFYDRGDAEAAYDGRKDVVIRGKPATVEFARGQRKTSREMRVNDGMSHRRRRSPSPRRHRRRHDRRRSYSRSYSRSRSPPRRSRRSGRQYSSRSRSGSWSRSRSRSRSRDRGSSRRRNGRYSRRRRSPSYSRSRSYSASSHSRSRSRSYSRSRSPLPSATNEGENANANVNSYNSPSQSRTPTPSPRRSEHSDAGNEASEAAVAIDNAAETEEGAVEGV